MTVAALLARVQPAPAGTAGADETGPALAVTGLVKAYGASTVLAGVAFEARAGEALALIGANGSGKSTLLRCLIRLTEPTAGEVVLLGCDVGGLRGRALRRFRSRVGVVWQRHNLVPRLTVFANVLHGAQARMGGPRAWFPALAPGAARAEAMACLSRVGLADRAGARADALSGGQQQRVAIARMLMQRPEAVLADEPDASLDPRSGEEVMRILADLARRDGLPVILVSHRLEHALAWSDRVLGLAGGRVALDLETRRADPARLRRFFDRPSEAAS